MSDDERGPSPYKAPAVLPTTVDAARDRSPILHRGGGALALAGGGVLVYLGVVERVPSLRMLATGAILVAMGGWMMAFGYPRNAEGLAPLWSADRFRVVGRWALALMRAPCILAASFFLL